MFEIVSNIHINKYLSGESFNIVDYLWETHDDTVGRSKILGEY